MPESPAFALKKRIRLERKAEEVSKVPPGSSSVFGGGLKRRKLTELFSL